MVSRRPRHPSGERHRTEPDRAGRRLPDRALAGPDGARRVRARKIVLATGIEGSGGWQVQRSLGRGCRRNAMRTPPMPSTSGGLRRRIAILGGGASVSTTRRWRWRRVPRTWKYCCDGPASRGSIPTCGRTSPAYSAISPKWMICTAGGSLGTSSRACPSRHRTATGGAGSSRISTFERRCPGVAEVDGSRDRNGCGDGVVSADFLIAATVSRPISPCGPSLLPSPGRSRCGATASCRRRARRAR